MARSYRLMPTTTEACVIWVDSYLQVALEAIVDLSRFSRQADVREMGGRCAKLDLSSSTSARHVAVRLGLGRLRRVTQHHGVPIPPVTAIGVRIARPEILTVGIGIELRAIAGVFDDRLRQSRCCERCGGNSGSANQCYFHLGLLDNESIGGAKYIRTRLQSRQ